jgi:hypothetical protein
MKKVRIFPNYPKVEIFWNDAFSRYGWKDKAEFLEMAKHGLTCKSTGYLVWKDKKYIILAHGLAEGENGDFQDLLAIPSGMVRSIHRIK